MKQTLWRLTALSFLLTSCGANPLHSHGTEVGNGDKPDPNEERKSQSEDPSPTTQGSTTPENAPPSGSNAGQPAAVMATPPVSKEMLLRILANSCASPFTHHLEVPLVLQGKMYSAAKLDIRIEQQDSGYRVKLEGLHDLLIAPAELGSFKVSVEDATTHEKWESSCSEKVQVSDGPDGIKSYAASVLVPGFAEKVKLDWQLVPTGELAADGTPLWRMVSYIVRTSAETIELTAAKKP